MKEMKWPIHLNIDWI